MGIVIGRGLRAIRQGRGRAVKKREAGWGGGAGGRGGAGAGQVGEDGLYDAGVLDGGDDAQPGLTAGTGEDVEGEHAAHQGRPGPGVGGAGDAGAGLELARGGVGGRAAEIRPPLGTPAQHPGRSAS